MTNLERARRAAGGVSEQPVSEQEVQLRWLHEQLDSADYTTEDGAELPAAVSYTHLRAHETLMNL
eukprot:4902906-Prymnesium_polylepis.1